MDENTNTSADSGAVAGSRPPLGTLPVLMYDHGTDNNLQTAFAIADQSLHTSVVPELSTNYYHVTPHGWVLLVAPGPSRRTRLWDPRTGESIALPAMDRELPENWKCYLSGAPTAAAASSCVVLVLDMDEPSFVYCRAGDLHWSAHEYDIGEVRLPPAPIRKRVIHQASAVGGKFYFQEIAKMGVIDFSSAEPVFSFLDYEHVEYPDGSNIKKEYMVESRGELFNVCIFLKGFTSEIMTVRVYRMDLSGAPTLCELDDLGDRTFLVSYPNAQLLCSASKYGVRRNCIYFNHNVTEELDGGFVYIYDMECKSLEALRPCPEMEELLCNPFWMMPTDQNCTCD